MDFRGFCEACERLLFSKGGGTRPGGSFVALSKNFCQERRSLMDKALALRSQSPGLDSRRVRVYCPKRRGEERGDPGGPGLCVRPACEACEAL